LFYLFGNLDFLGKYDGLNGIAPIAIGPWSLQSGRAICGLIWVVVLGAALALRHLLDSRSGRAMRALNGSALMAESMGVDTARLRIVCFVLAALLASVSGWLYAHMQRAVNPTPFGLNAGIEYLFMAVIGGAGHVGGALLGAAVLTILKDRLQSILPALLGSSGNYEVIVFGVLMVVMLQHARDGLWPLLHSALQRWLPPRAMRRRDADETGGMAHALPQRLPAAPGTLLLQVDQLGKRFGGLVAVDAISLSLHAGEILGPIGPNGAGKSTLFNLLSGVIASERGEVRLLYDGQLQRTERLPSRQIARRGLSRSFQQVRLLPGMSVLDNVALGAHLRGRRGVVAAICRTNRREEASLFALARSQLERVGLAAQMHQDAGSLALGQQRLLEIARALCSDPSVLLLDEPAAGLRHHEKRALAALLRVLRDDGMGILLVEHDMEFVMQLTDRLVVMEFGRCIAAGTPAQVQADPAVLQAYLGAID
ncbi:MAG: branched-chain amino acid ABC transporter ATP-binding protein/permease, partial [Pseudomonadota bacterium]|nr:branched-chain amino acid ABC transporter ATP-binding protein/permease [Pseudomonadota bacterium]